MIDEHDVPAGVEGLLDERRDRGVVSVDLSHPAVQRDDLGDDPRGGLPLVAD